MLDQDLGEHGAKVSGQREVSALVQLFGREAGPLAVDFAPSDRTSGEENATRMPVISAARAVLPDRAPELGHRDDHDVMHTVSQVAVQRCETITKILQTIRKLAARAALIGMSVPSGDIRKGHLQSNFRFH